MLKAIFFDADNTLYDTGMISKAADTAAMKVMAARANAPHKRLYREWLEIVDRVKNSKNPRIRHRRYSYGLLVHLIAFTNKRQYFFLGSRRIVIPHHHMIRIG